MKYQQLKTVFGLLACATLLGGCVVGQSLPAEYQAPPAAVAAGRAKVAVVVADERTYVKSGDKPPYFIGQYRGGFGNPWDVTTKDKAPLANLLERDLVNEIKSLGYVVVPRADASRVLDVSIADWKFDGMVNGKFWYELHERVMGADGSQLASSNVMDSQVIEGSVWTGAKGAFEAKMPELYAGAIRKLVRENPAIAGALNSGAETH